MRILVLTKRQYTSKDLIDDRYGRLWEIPSSLAKKGNEIIGICLSYRKKRSGLHVDEDENSMAVRWHSVNIGVFYIFGLIRFFLIARKMIKQYKPDIIWSCSDTFYGVLGYYFSRKYQCRSVIDLYDNFESFASYHIPILRTLFRKAVRESDGLSCVSTNLEEHIRINYKREKPIAVITNAINTETFYPMDKLECRKKLGLPLDAKIIGTAGDLSEQRGGHIMFRAMLEKKDQPLNVHLAIAGSRATGTMVPKSDRIHDLGTLPPRQVPVLINALDVAVVYNRTSLFGDYCFPQKLYEILACQRPIVAANVGVMSTILKDKPHLLYTEDDIESYVDAIKKQLANQEKLTITIPTWSNQADLLQNYMFSMISNA
ncbi:MAG: hypothetical protein BMS9Abin11_0648 [Gammaproteobacteria bacterium]|nr:MAG: hypothetical protein BMS9Abin11_0648 [Gammaproteobacteria bacterium]